jgi:hypothetical protein
MYGELEQPWPAPTIKGTLSIIPQRKRLCFQDKDFIKRKAKINPSAMLPESARLEMVMTSFILTDWVDVVFHLFPFHCSSFLFVCLEEFASFLLD